MQTVGICKKHCRYVLLQCDSGYGKNLFVLWQIQLQHPPSDVDLQVYH